MIRDSFQRFSIRFISNTLLRATDFLLAISFLYVSFRTVRDYQKGGKAALPFVPLYFIAVDWGRWMSFHVFSLAILTACAMVHNKFQLDRTPSGAHIIPFVAVSLIVSPSHEIGIYWGGALGRLASEFWRILS